MLHSEMEGNGAASGSTSMTTFRGYAKYFLSSCVSWKPNVLAATTHTTHQNTRPGNECALMALGTPLGGRWVRHQVMGLDGVGNAVH